jgi:uncharacterized protein YndB with AHSA1/START domain
MGATTHSIEVHAPLRAVYDQWARFEDFPRFMEGVEEVRKQGRKGFFWKAKIGGKDKQWQAEITEQVPEKRIAWASVDGTSSWGEVTFESLDPERTRITLTMEYEPEGFLEKAGDALGIPSGRVEGDLKRFRDFIEKRKRETAEHPTELTGDPSHLAAGPGNAKFDRDRAVGTPTHDQIAIRAYELYLERGRAPGNVQQDWLEAERELSERYGDKSSRNSAQSNKIVARIINVVQQKGSGYTVVVELPPEADISSDESWRVSLPGDFRGATRVEGLWHLYYGEKPNSLPGDTFDII